MEDTLVSSLIGEGWRQWGGALDKIILTKRLHTERSCQCNKKSPNLVCEIDLFCRDKGISQYVTYAVTGQVQDVWYRLAAYSMTPDQAWEARRQAERNLLKAWDALR